MPIWHGVHPCFTKSENHEFGTPPRQTCCLAPRHPLGSPSQPGCASRQHLGSHALHLGNPSKPLGSHTLTSLRRLPQAHCPPYLYKCWHAHLAGFTHVSQRLKNIKPMHAPDLHEDKPTTKSIERSQAHAAQRERKAPTRRGRVALHAHLLASNCQAARKPT